MWLVIFSFFLLIANAGAPRLTDALRKEYNAQFAALTIRPEKSAYVTARVDRISHFQEKYEIVARVTDIPWYVIAVIDELEGGGGCSTHLHNGDSLQRRTVNVPAGRPADGEPPFNWYDSALDALDYDGLLGWEDWTLAGILYRLESYNGWGYRSRKKPSPYLWSFGLLPGWDGRGKFTRDNYYDPTAVSRQVGAAVLLKRMVTLELINIPSERSSR